MTASPAFGKGLGTSTNTMNSRNKTGLHAVKSSDSLDRLAQVQKICLQCKPLQTLRNPKKEAMTLPENLRDVSRLELLLAPKKFRQVFRPFEETVQAQVVNRAIRLSAQWTDIDVAVSKAHKLTPGNAAYALQRLGCLNSYASKKRKADLALSGLTPILLETATCDMACLDAGCITLVLDGCARLHHTPPSSILDDLATAAQRMARSFDNSQLPLVLWAFSILDYVPRSSVLDAFDEAIPCLGESMNPQGICLTLSGFQAAQHQPSKRTTDWLAGHLQRQLLMFKPSEIATCLEAFSFFGYEPSESLIAAILEQTGQCNHTNKPVAKPKFELALSFSAP